METPYPLLAPVVALVAWTLVVQVWMIATRFAALGRKGISLKGRRGGHGRQLDGVVEDEVQWKAHNYNHLLEQPTIFYAIVLALAVIGQNHPFNVGLAWSYVVLRIVHSLVQATVNIVAIRFALYMLSSLALVALVVHAAMAWIH